MEAEKHERILLLQLKRIGDFILTAPAVAALRRAHPHAEIVAVVPSSVAGLASCFPGITGVRAYAPRTLNLRTWVTIAAGVWDWCFDFAGTDRTAFMSRLSRAKHRVGYRKFADTASKQLAYTQLCEASVRDLHTVDFHLALVAEAQADAQGGKTSAPDAAEVFRLPSSIIVRTQTKLREAGVCGPFAVIQAGSAREEKFWLADRWAEVACAIVEEKGLQIVLTGLDDATERAHLAELRQAMKVPFVDFTGRLSLLESAAVIAAAEIVLGVDSMAMHLAAMFEKPQVVLFGPTNAFHWRPRHDRAAVVFAAGDAVAEKLEPKAAGAPMNLISTGTVTDAMRAALRQPA